MEGNVFPDPAVAGILSENYVEARLHLETFQDAGGETWDNFVMLRETYARSVAMPTYAVMRPSDREQTGWYQLEGGPTTWVPGIKKFLEGSMQ